MIFIMFKKIFSFVVITIIIVIIIIVIKTFQQIDYHFDIKFILDFLTKPTISSRST